MSKYYAVLKGRTTGIFTDWNSTQLSVGGYSGAAHKSFKTRREAEEFLGISKSDSVKNDLTKIQVKEIKDSPSTDFLKVYTDGSHSAGNGGVGIVIVGSGDVVIKELSIKVAEYPTTNQRAELYGIYLTMFNIFTMSSKNVEIITDSEYSVNIYNNWIHNWIKNNWKTSSGEEVKNSDIIIKTHDLLKKCEKEGIKITIKWVKGHSTNYFNNLADKLAVAGRLS